MLVKVLIFEGNYKKVFEMWKNFTPNFSIFQYQDGNSGRHSKVQKLLFGTWLNLFSIIRFSHSQTNVYKYFHM